MKQAIKLFVKAVFLKFGFQISRVPVRKRSKFGDKPNPIHLWDDDETFRSLAKQVAAYTCVGQERCFILYQFAKQVRDMYGDVAEVGVYKGGTARLISEIVAETAKTVHLFDTFSGMPPTDMIKDLHKEGDFSDTSLDSVKEYLNDYDNVRFYQGFFPDTSKPVIDRQFCLVHIDVDIRKSVIDCCEFFYPRMVKGGIMVFDDYGFLTCPGAKMAVDEFFLDKPECSCYLPTGQCFVIKL